MIKLAIAALLVSTGAFGGECKNEFHRFWPFDKNLARNDISIDVDALLTLRASCDQIDAFTSAEVKGKIKDNNLKMLEMDIKAKSNQNSAMSLNGSLYIMGYELKNMDIDQKNFIELSEAPYFDFDEAINISLPIGPVEIPIDMGYTGELAAKLNANLNAWTNELSAIPSVNANLYIASVLDVQVAEAKFGGNLLLANEEIELAANASLDMDGDSTSLLINANAGHNLEALKGKVFVSGNLKLDEPKEFYKELINFDGYTHNKNFYSIDKTVEL